MALYLHLTEGKVGLGCVHHRHVADGEPGGAPSPDDGLRDPDDGTEHVTGDVRVVRADPDGSSDKAIWMAMYIYILCMALSYFFLEKNSIMIRALRMLIDGNRKITIHIIINNFLMDLHL